MSRDVVRATRVEKRTADALDEVAKDLGIKPGAVDRQILEFMSGALNDHHKPGESLAWFFYQMVGSK